MLLKMNEYVDSIETKEIVLMGALFLVVAAGAIFAPGFLTIRNAMNTFRVASTVGILALGQSFVILTGELDLSIGSILSLSVISGALFLSYGTGFAILVTILLGLFLGFINGIFVAYFDIDSLMMTLGTLSVFGGIANIVSRGQSVFLRGSPWYLWLGQGSIFNVPVPGVIFIFLIVLSFLFLSFTALGKQLYYTGANEKAAVYSGISNKKIKVLAFTLSGLFASISGPLIGARVGRIIPYQGEGLEITAIVMAVFGGIALKGGKGTVLGVAIGIIVYQAMINVLKLSGMGSYMEQVIRGLLLIFIVVIYRYTERNK